MSAQDPRLSSINRRIRNGLRRVGSLVLLAGFGSCRSLSPWPPANFSEPGWTVRQGQAVWRSKAGSPEIAGELVWASHAGGRAFMQFTKTPLPLLIAQTTGTGWQIEFVAECKTLRGRGRPPTQLGWLHLARCLSGTNPPKGWLFQTNDDGSWRLENRKTGERLEGYLAP